MADPVIAPVTPTPPTDQTNPLDAGHTTTEYGLARWAAIAGIALAVLSTIVDLTNRLVPLLPDFTWITTVGVVAGTLVTVLSTVLYGQQRSNLKIAALKAGSAVGTPQSAVRG